MPVCLIIYLTQRLIFQFCFRSRIPTAGFFDIDAIADQTVDLPHMLPDTELFEKEIGKVGNTTITCACAVYMVCYIVTVDLRFLCSYKLGVSNDSHVVVYDNNESVGIFSAARVWWTLRV